VLPTLKSCTVHKIIEYLTLALLFSLWNICRSTIAYFCSPTLYICVCFVVELVTATALVCSRTMQRCYARVAHCWWHFVTAKIDCSFVLHSLLISHLNSRHSSGTRFSHLMQALCSSTAEHEFCHHKSQWSWVHVVPLKLTECDLNCWI